MNFNINVDSIEASFDRIAKEILLRTGLMVNRKLFRFTEIEFYYYNEDCHPDKYTHEHNRGAGEWRFHNQGIDITFESSEKIDGGILIRGVLVDGKYINGPRKIWNPIFKAFGKVHEKTSFVLYATEDKYTEIIKTFRKLSDKIIDTDYHSRHYRYLIDLDKLDIPKSEKSKILQNHEILNIPNF